MVLLVCVHLLEVLQQTTKAHGTCKIVVGILASLKIARNEFNLDGLVVCCRLSLDQEDILTWNKHSQAQVLLLAALSAKWSNNDAIDRAVTNAVEGGQEVCAHSQCKGKHMHRIDTLL